MKASCSPTSLRVFSTLLDVVKEIFHHGKNSVIISLFVFLRMLIWKLLKVFFTSSVPIRVVTGL